MVEFDPKVTGGGTIPDQQEEEDTSLEAPTTEAEAQQPPEDLDTEDVQVSQPQNGTGTTTQPAPTTQDTQPAPTTQDTQTQRTPQPRTTTTESASDVTIASGPSRVEPSSTQPPEVIDPTAGATFEASARTRRVTAAAPDSEMQPELDEGAVRLTESGEAVFSDAALTDSGDVTDAAKRELAAIKFDERFPDVDISRSDIETSSEGFTLTETAQRRVAASQFDEQFSDVDIRASDVDASDGAFRVDESVQREIAAGNIEAQLSERGVDVDLTGSDIERGRDGGFTVDESGQRKIAAVQFSERLPRDVDPEDIDIETVGTGVTEEGNIRFEQQGGVPEIDERAVLDAAARRDVELDIAARDVPELKQDVGEPLLGPSSPTGPGREGVAPEIKQEAGEPLDFATEERLSGRRTSIIEERALDELNEQAERRYGVELDSEDIEVVRTSGSVDTQTGEVSRGGFSVSLSEQGEETIREALEEQGREERFGGTSDIEEFLREGTEGLSAGIEDVVDLGVGFTTAPIRTQSEIAGRAIGGEDIVDFTADAEQFEIGEESDAQQFAEGVFEGPATLVASGPVTVLEAGEFVAAGGSAVGDDVVTSLSTSDVQVSETGEFVSDTGAAIQETIASVEQSLADRPFKTSGQLAGSLVATGGATAVARRVGGARAARTVEFSFQPVESTVVSGINRVAPASVVSRIPGGRLDNEEIAIATGAQLAGGAKAAALRTRRRLSQLDVDVPRSQFLADTRGQFEVGSKMKEVEVEVEEEVEEDIEVEEEDVPFEVEFAGGLNIREFGFEPESESRQTSRTQETVEVESEEDPLAGVTAEDISATLARDLEAETEVESEEDPLAGLTRMVESEQSIEEQLGVESEQKVSQETELPPGELESVEVMVEPESKQRVSQETEFRDGPLLESEVLVEPMQEFDLAAEDMVEQQLGEDLLLDQQLSQEALMEQELSQRLELQQELQQQLQIEQELEAEVEVEVEQELEAELELQQELELESELEAELEVQPEGELEVESEVFPEDKRDRRRFRNVDVSDFEKVFERNVASAEDVLELDESVGGQ